MKKKNTVLVHVNVIQNQTENTVLVVCANTVQNQTQEDWNKDPNSLQNVTQDMPIDMVKALTKNASDDHIHILIVEGRGHARGQKINMFINQSVKGQI